MMVSCGPLQRSQKEPNALINPTLIIEVLSTSTESYDRGDKFFAYRQTLSLNEYILIDQYKAQVDIYTRTEELWKINRVEGLDAQLEIASLGISVSLARVYEDVNFQL